MAQDNTSEHTPGKDTREIHYKQDLVPIDKVQAASADSPANEDRVSRLASNIATVGLIHSIAVDQGYNLIAGANRLAALRQISAQDPEFFKHLFAGGMIPVRKYPFDAAKRPDLMLKIRASENLMRRRVSKEEFARMAKEYVEKGLTSGRGHPEDGEESLVQALMASSNYSERSVQGFVKELGLTKPGRPKKMTGSENKQQQAAPPDGGNDNPEPSASQQEAPAEPAQSANCGLTETKASGNTGADEAGDHPRNQETFDQPAVETQDATVPDHSEGEHPTEVLANLSDDDNANSPGLTDTMVATNQSDPMTPAATGTVSLKQAMEVFDNLHAMLSEIDRPQFIAWIAIKANPDAAS